MDVRKRIALIAHDNRKPDMIDWARYNRGTLARHDLFATVHGNVSLDNNRATIDRLWNRFVAAWYEGGKDDPKLALLRLDPERAEIWADASSLFAGIKLLLGADPKDEYKDKVAKVILR